MAIGNVLCTAMMAAGAVALAAATVAAQGLKPQPRLSSVLASEAVGEAVASCVRQGYTASAVLLDFSGVPQAILRGDGAGPHSVRMANDKAYTSVTFKVDTMALVERARAGQSVPSAITKVPHLVLAPGGLVIKIGEQVIGAIGVSGAPNGEHDAVCAKAGLDAIKDRMK